METIPIIDFVVATLEIFFIGFVTGTAIRIIIKELKNKWF